MTAPTPSRNAWVQLYEARRVSTQPQTRPPGRPTAPIPRRKVGVTLSEGEISELEAWQIRFAELLRRNVSMGETIGILTRICTGRMSRLMEGAESTGISQMTLAQLVERLVGSD